MAKIALLGTGRMGQGIGKSLLASGHQLRVFNRTTEKTDGLVADGAIKAMTPADAVFDADAIISCVADDKASEVLWTGENGAIHGMYKTEAIAIECSTISLEWSNQLQYILDKASLRYVDCPVSGGPHEAKFGRLTAFVGAEEKAFKQAIPIMESFCRKYFYFGLPGSGTQIKLILNLISSLQILSLAEGLKMAQQSQLDMDTVVEAIISGASSSPIVRHFIQPMVDNQHFAVDFSLNLMAKDISYALQLAQQFNLNLPLSVQANHAFENAGKMGLGLENVSAIIKAI